MNPDLALALLVFAFGAIVPVSYGGYLGICAILDSRLRTKADRRSAENARIASGLPAHERCLCDECAAWRSIAGNITRLQS